KPLPHAKDIDVIWIGNWGDEERTLELQEFLIQPATSLTGKQVVAHGVRYSDSALRQLQDAGIEYRGYLPNLSTPEAYAQSLVTQNAHGKRYVNGFGEFPRIRVLEPLACVILLVCPPWKTPKIYFIPEKTTWW